MSLPLADGGGSGVVDREEAVDGPGVGGWGGAWADDSSSRAEAGGKDSQSGAKLKNAGREGRERGAYSRRTCSCRTGGREVRGGAGNEKKRAKREHDGKRAATRSESERADSVGRMLEEGKWRGNKQRNEQGPASVASHPTKGRSLVYVEREVERAVPQEGREDALDLQRGVSPG